MSKERLLIHSSSFFVYYTTSLTFCICNSAQHPPCVGLLVGCCRQVFFVLPHFILHHPLHNPCIFTQVIFILSLQSVMNSAARLVFSSSRYDHITPLLRQLHWLKAAERIDFKLAVLVYKCLHGAAPSYLADELCLSAVWDLSPRRRLRSAPSSSLVVHRKRLSTIGDRAFPVVAAHVWNGLPQHVTSAPSLPTFSRRLKTHLFQRYFP